MIQDLANLPTQRNFKLSGAIFSKSALHGVADQFIDDQSTGDAAAQIHGDGFDLYGQINPIFRPR